MANQQNLSNIVDHLNSAAVGLGRAAEEVKGFADWADTMQGVINYNEIRISELEERLRQEKEYKKMLITALKGLFNLYE